MTRLALFLFCSFAALAPMPAAAAPVESAAFSGADSAGHSYRKQPGDLSYGTMWRMQKRASAMQPRGGRLLTPVLRLAVDGVDERERNEFLPAPWAVAVMSKSAEVVVPMRRGGYFSVPAIANAQLRSEDAIVRFNTEQRKKRFDIGWQLAVPASGKLSYSELGKAFEELKAAQQDMAWWDIMAISEKNARFDAIRACFTDPAGHIEVGGAPAGTRLSAHCTLLGFDPAQAGTQAEIVFAGAIDSVTLDRRDNYPQ